MCAEHKCELNVQPRESAACITCLSTRITERDRAGVNQRESPWERAAGRVSTLQACWGHAVHGSLVQKSQLPRHSDAGLCPPCVCIFSLFSLGNEALANLACVFVLT